jgi:tetratricopeptide (TPR) repeat protein
VPLWIRKILLRGLRVNADERYPSMYELLDALGKNPAVTRRRLMVTTTALLLAAGLGFGMRQGLADPKPVCGGGSEKLAGIWELVPPGAAETPRQTQLHEAFRKSGKSYAKDVWATTSRSLTNYARAWTDMYKETCESAVVNKVQSTEVMDLRMECLNERLGGLHALTDVFADANGEVVENAVSASNALASLDRCADVPLLRAVVRPPEDAETRAKVDGLRQRLANLKAQFDAGKYRETLKDAPMLIKEARGLGYEPLLAEALALLGTIHYKSSDSGAAEAALVEAFRIADSARHDEVRAEAATDLVFVVGYLQGHFREGHEWAKTAEAILKRVGGHDLLHAWLSNDLGCLHDLEGNLTAAVVDQQRALALKQKALGSEHPDLGISEGNLAMSLQGLGRNEEALTHVQRGIRILETGLGVGHPDLAVLLSNQGEILNALRKYPDARASFERAKTIWQRELGANNPNLAYALTGIGVSYVDEGAPVVALASLEEAFKIREEQDPDPLRKAETRFAFARALWDSKRDKAKARVLAEEARAVYAEGGAKAKLAEVETWLRLNGGARTAQLVLKD